MTSTMIFACHDPQGSHWQLGHLTATVGRITLIGWRQEPTPLDNGIPREIAVVLSRALASIAWVIFPCSTLNCRSTVIWSPCGDDFTCTLSSSSLIERIRARLMRVPSEIVLVSTRKLETILRLFNDAHYPWWLQGQVVLLSATDMPQPALDRQLLLSLLGDNWASQAMSFATQRHIGGVLRPGVDGDLIGIRLLTDTFEQAFLTALKKETQLAGYTWALLSENAFACQFVTQANCPDEIKPA